MPQGTASFSIILLFAIACLGILGVITLWTAWEWFEYHRSRLGVVSTFRRDQRLDEVDLDELDTSNEQDDLRLVPVSTRSATGALEAHDLNPERGYTAATIRKKTDPMSAKDRWQGAVKTINRIQAVQRGLEWNQLTSTWKNIKPTVTPPAECGQIGHMQFSPSGDLLAVCGDKGCCLFKVDGESDGQGILTSYMRLVNTSGRQGPSKQGTPKQAEWSPDGMHLLIRTKRGFQVWKFDEEYASTYPSSSHSI